MNDVSHLRVKENFKKNLTSVKAHEIKLLTCIVATEERKSGQLEVSFSIITSHCVCIIREPKGNKFCCTSSPQLKPLRKIDTI